MYLDDDDILSNKNALKIITNNIDDEKLDEYKHIIKTDEYKRNLYKLLKTELSEKLLDFQSSFKIFLDLSIIPSSVNLNKFFKGILSNSG